MRPSRTVILLAVWLLAVFGQAQGQGLIGDEVERNRWPLDLSMEESLASRYRLVRVNPEVTAGSNFEINLFNDTVFVAEMRAREVHGRVQTWQGFVAGQANSSVVVATHPTGIIFAKIEFDGRSFVIQYKAHGVHSVIEVDMTKMPAEDDDDYLIDTPSGEGSESGHDSSVGKLESISQLATNADVCSAESTCSDQVLDVMVIYSQAATSAMGGAASTEAAIAVGIAELNLVASNSGLGHSFRLALAREVAYTETGSANSDLNALRFADGLLDDIHVWRDSVGADLVHLVLDTGGCGIGNLTASPTEFSSVRSYSVSDDVCFRFNKTFPHELGHNMGLRHDRYMDASPTPCSWAHGYVNQSAFGGTTDKRWRTVMAYNNQCADAGFNCTRQAYYSNPDNTLTSDSMGIAIDQPDAANANYLLDRSMCVVADYRDVPPDTLVFATFQEGYQGYSGARDTKISDGAQTTSYGSDVLLQADGCCPDLSSLLYWDVSTIPAGAVVVAVDISLSVNDASGATHELYAVNREWDESTATWLRPRTGENWQTAGAQGSLDRGTTVLGTATSLYTGVLNVRLNAAGVASVQSWVDGTIENFGLTIQDYGSAASDGLYFDSRETTEIGRHPRLTIQYFVPTAPSGSELAAKVLLEGAWNGSSMNANLGQVLPTTHPYADPPWLYAGDDSVSSLDVSGASGVPDFFETTPTIVDWVLVQLRSGTPPDSQIVEAERAAFLHTDGTLTDLDGTSNLRFPDLSPGQYFVVIDHRNHLAVMSDSLIDFTTGVGTHDFTSAIGSAFSSGGVAMISLDPSTFAMFAGDGDADNQITASDFNDWLVATKSVQTGYLTEDFSLDSQCTVADFNLWLSNTKSIAVSQVPD
ncbi:DNRLRE domain-containing protein [Bacteroidota bacterium]